VPLVGDQPPESPPSPRKGEERRRQLPFRWMASNPGQGASPYVPGRPAVGTPTGSARSMAFLHAALRLGTYDRVRVAANSNSTAAAFRSSATVSNDSQQPHI
jgi:hypothetical protein